MKTTTLFICIAIIISLLTYKHGYNTGYIAASKRSIQVFQTPYEIKDNRIVLKQEQPILIGTIEVESEKKNVY